MITRSGDPREIQGNLVSGPSGTTLTGAVLPLYTLQAGDSNYETISSNMLTPPEAYWAYFTSATPVPLPTVTGTPISVSLPANQYVMVGNPFADTALLSGADQVLIYLPGGSNYAAVTVLNAGQGAWAFSRTGGALTIAPASSQPIPKPKK